MCLAHAMRKANLTAWPLPTSLAGIPLLPVANVRRSIDFYVSVLDFKMGFNAGEYGGVRRDAIEIHFWRTDDPSLAKMSSCRIEVTQIRQLYAHCREAGVVDPNGDIAAQTWGTTEFVVLDPDGNRLTFVEVFGLGS